jgi:hypothetical protein
MATCGVGGQCYVKNDGTVPFHGTVAISALKLSTGQRKAVYTEEHGLGAGAGVSERFTVDLSGIDPAEHILLIACATAGTTLSLNELLLATPHSLRLPAASVSAAVGAAPNPDGSIDIALQADATALFVTLTTLAHGRFSDNAFALAPGHTTIQFMPFGALDAPTLRKSLRVEHLQQNQ